MFLKRRTPHPVALADDSREPLASTMPEPLRFSRVVLMVSVALSAVPLGVGVWTALPAQKREVLQEGLARAGRRLQVVASWYRLDPAGTGGGGAAVPLTQTAPPALPPQPPPAAAPRQTGPVERTELAYGDRLKVTFYESLGFTVDVAGPERPVTTIFPRLDLSAEYVLDAHGLIAVPKLGPMHLAGMQLGAATTALEAAFRRAFGRPAEVRIAILERQPIYVLGAVRAAGAFAYRPGMTVLQALATAGGPPDATGDASASIETIREGQLLYQAQARLARLLISRARLEALRADTDTLALPAELSGRRNAADTPIELDGLLADLLAGARAGLRAERGRYEQQRALAEQQLQVATTELRAQQLRFDQLDALVARKTDRLRELETIAARGSVAHFKLTDIAADIADVAARREDARVGIAQGDRRLLEAQTQLARLVLEHGAGIDKALAEVEQDIAETKPRIAAMHAVLQVLRGATAAAAQNAAAPLSFVITRRTEAGPAIVAADAQTGLLPGDVIEVRAGDRRQQRPRPADEAATQ